MVEFERLIAHFGPAVVFAGAGLEGHTAVIAGGLLAHQKLMSVWVSFGSACAGSWLADQMLFLLGRRGRDARFVQRAMTVPAFDKAVRFVARYPILFTLSFRFLYGLRMAGPVALGMSSIPARRFFVLNVLGAALWAGVFTAIGYVFGHALEAWLGRLHWSRGGMAWAILAVAAVPAAYWAVSRIGPKSRDRLGL